MPDTLTLGLAGIATGILRRWRTIAMAGLLTGLFAGAITFTRAPRYGSSATVTPVDPGNDVSRLAGVAAQFGVNLPGGSSNQTSDYYAEILRSPSVLGPVVDSAYTVPSGDTTARAILAEYLEPDADSKALGRELAMRDVLRMTDINSQPQLGLLRFTVRAASPSLAWQIASALLDQLQAMNVRTRQVQAAAGRAFLEGRATIAKAAMRSAEDSLLAFLQKNRDFSNSPTLSFEHDRIQRSVQMRQALYVTLMQSLDQASMDAVRNTPELVVVEAPVIPAQRLPRGTVMMTVVFGMLGALGGMMWVVMSEQYERARKQEPQVYGSLEEAWRGFLAEIVTIKAWRPWTAARVKRSDV